MPRHIIIVLDDHIVDLADLNVDDAIIEWLLTELWKIILTRLGQLPEKAKPDYLTLLTIFKPLPKPQLAEPSVMYTRMKRLILRSIDHQVDYINIWEQ